MILLTDDLRIRLRANAIQRRATLDRVRLAAARNCSPEPDPAPVVKLFNPLGPATWLASELDADGDTLFGLADLGFGCPELGSFSLSELADVSLPFGMGIERDIAFETDVALSVWTEFSRRAGSILQAERILRRALRGDDELPPSGG